VPEPANEAADDVNPEAGADVIESAEDDESDV